MALAPQEEALGICLQRTQLVVYELEDVVWRRVGGGELDVLADLGGVQMRILLLLGTGMREQVWMCRVKGW